MNLKIDKQLLKDLNDIAEMEYSSPEGILIRGLIIFTQYAKRIDLTGNFKGKNGLEEAEKYIEELAQLYGEDVNEIVFGCIDAFRDKVLGIGLKERINISERKEVYMFIDDIHRGKILGTYNVDSSINELHKIIALRREEDKIEQEKMLESYIENARQMFKEAEKELKQIEIESDKANKEHTKVANEHRLLNVEEVFKFTAQQRINHKEKLDKKKAELAEIATTATRLSQKLESKRYEVRKIKEDIVAMQYYITLNEIPTWKLNGKYNPKKDKVASKKIIVKDPNDFNSVQRIMR